MYLLLDCCIIYILQYISTCITPIIYKQLEINTYTLDRKKAISESLLGQKSLNNAQNKQPHCKSSNWRVWNVETK